MSLALWNFFVDAFHPLAKSHDNRWNPEKSKIHCRCDDDDDDADTPRREFIPLSYLLDLLKTQNLTYSGQVCIYMCIITQNSLISAANLTRRPPRELALKCFTHPLDAYTHIYARRARPEKEREWSYTVIVRVEDVMEVVARSAILKTNKTLWLRQVF